MHVILYRNYTVSKVLTGPKVENSIQAIACVAYFDVIFLSLAKEEISH